MNGLRAIFLVLLSAVSTFALPEGAFAGQADTAYLQMEGVPGQSTEKAHKGWIELTSWSWGVATRAGSMGSARFGAGGGRAGQLRVTMDADAASHPLMEATANGKAFKKVVLEVVTTKPNETSRVFLTLTMEDVLVASYSVAEPPTGKTPSARVTLSYAKMTSTYAPRNPDGSKGTAIPTEGSWDLKAAQKI